MLVDCIDLSEENAKNPWRVFGDSMKKRRKARKKEQVGKDKKRNDDVELHRNGLMLNSHSHHIIDVNFGFGITFSFCCLLIVCQASTLLLPSSIIRRQSRTTNCPIGSAVYIYE